MAESLIRCPVCGGEVSPNDPDLVYGIEQIEIETIGPTPTVRGQPGRLLPSVVLPARVELPASEATSRLAGLSPGWHRPT